MDHVLKKYCPRIEFDSYEDFAENFRIEVPEAFNFGFDVVDEWAAVEPEKRALLWCNDAGEERTFTFTDIKHLSNQAANAFADMGIGKGDVVMCILRRRWEYWVCAVALCKLGASIIPASLQLTRKDDLIVLQSTHLKTRIRNGYCGVLLPIHRGGTPVGRRNPMYRPGPEPQFNNRDVLRPYHTAHVHFYLCTQPLEQLL